MTSFDDITKLFAIDMEGKFCIDIEFLVAGLSDYQNCWMGKMPDRVDRNKEMYWFGLAQDGSKAYDYNNYIDFVNAPVFDGRSLKAVWDSVELLSVDGCEPEWRIKNLLD